MSENNHTVRAERSGWRDLALSERHRQWGWDCPALDLDFLFLEYDRGKATAIVEYKHEKAPSLKVWHPTFRAMIDLGDRAGLPVFAVRYAGDFSWWKVHPLNPHAQRWLAESSLLSERQWVELLYRIRGHPLPENLFNTANSTV
jgi:hypothetical protein